MIQLNSCQIITFLSSKFLEYNDRVVSEIVLDNGVRVMNESGDEYESGGSGDEYESGGSGDEYELG